MVSRNRNYQDKEPHSLPISSVLFIPNEPIEVYYQFKQTYNMYPFKYFDLLGVFGKAYFSYLSPEKSGEEKKGKFVIQRVKRTNIFKSKFLNYLNIFDYFKFISRTARLVKRNNIQLIRAYNNHIEGFLACIIGKMTKVPVVVSVHNDFYYERSHTKKSDIISYVFINNIQRILEFFTNRMATKIFCVSNHLKKEISKKGHIREEKIEVIYNKVELEKFRHDDKKEQQGLIRKYNLENKKVFLFLGRFVWQKNVFRLLEAFSIIRRRHEDARLLMVSDGPLRQDIERYIKENGLTKSVHILGFVSNDILPSLFRLSDAFVLPSLYEGFGIVLIEAQAAGCPIIVSDIPSVKDIVNEKNSWMFEPLDPKEMARHMEMFFDRKNEKIIRQKVISGSVDVKRFEWDTLARNELRLYHNELI
jgi:glycosyltransferase involved in cell wall biosynthesis